MKLHGNAPFGPKGRATMARRLLTLTVHHRAGNPLAGGAAFDYPVTPGTGWIKIGPGAVVVGPLEENAVREAMERIERANQAALIADERMPAARCLVPGSRAAA